jgi:hypothetical protein
MRLFPLLLLCVLPACGSSPPPVVASPSTTTAPEPSAGPVASAPTPPAPAPTPAAPLTPGVVIVGEIIGPPKFDPKAALTTLKPDLLRCYNETRTLIPALRGKLTLTVKINDTGAVTSTEARAGGQANDPGLVACIGDAMKGATFPRPGGSATMTVPLVFKP